MTGAPDPRRPPYWLVPVFAALMLAPPAWAAATLIAAAIALTTLGEARRRRARRARSAALGASTGRGAAAVALGRDPRGRAVVLTDDQLSAHALIVGASGAGKTTTLVTILADHIRRGRPVIAIDLKGSPAFGRELALAAAGAGRPVRLWTPDGPSHWNPLRHGNPTELKDKLIGTERFTEPHYQRAAERYLQTVLQILEHVHAGDEPTFDEVVALMDPQRLAGRLRKLPRPLAERVTDYVTSLTPDQISGIRGFGTRLAVLGESHTGRFLMPPASGPEAIDLPRALGGREVVLFSLNASTYGKLSAQIGALVIQDLVAAAGRRLHEAPGGGSRQLAIVAIDEFSALGGDHVAALFARARESRLSVVLVTQELADLERAGAGLRDLVLGNTAVKLAHRQDVPASAQMIAQVAGTEDVWERSYHEHRWGPGTSRTTRRQVERFIVHPNEIKTLATGEAILITKAPVTCVQRVSVAAVATGPMSAGAVAGAVAQPPTSRWQDASRVPPRWGGERVAGPRRAPATGITSPIGPEREGLDR
jgi:type IV secretory pathway TraG/TraD family ATPase VirD4